jgi:hypothetical protein
MLKKHSDHSHRKIVLKTVIIFFIAYLLFLILWVGVKDYYGKGVTFTASKLAAAIKNITFEEMTEERDVIQATFSPHGRNSNILIDIPVKTSSYTFNAPLTFAIMAAMYQFIRKKRAYGEALLILLSVHLLYVFSLEVKLLTDVLIERGLEKANYPRIFFYQFLWGFTDNMVIRFEPFLIGFYMFIRFRK